MRTVGVGMYSFGGVTLVKPNANSVRTPQSAVDGATGAFALHSTSPARAVWGLHDAAS